MIDVFSLKVAKFSLVAVICWAVSNEPARVGCAAWRIQEKQEASTNSEGKTNSIGQPAEQESDPEVSEVDVPAKKTLDEGAPRIEKFDSDLAATVAELKNRVDELEAKQKQLLNLLFKTTKLQQQEAKRRYTEARLEYQNSERLHLQGVFDAFQVDLDRYTMERARLELMLSEANHNVNDLAAQVDWVESLRRLRIAEQRYQDAELKLAKGYMDKKLFERFKKAMKDRKKEVELQEERLLEVRKMMEWKSELESEVDDKK